MLCSRQLSHRVLCILCYLSDKAKATPAHSFDVALRLPVVANSFAQLVYSEPAELKDFLSDHCPLSISLDPSAGPEPTVTTRAQLLARLQQIEQEIQALRGLVMELPDQ